MDIRCACFDRHYENWATSAFSMTVHQPGTLTSATTTLYGPQLVYWHSAGVNRISWNGSFGITVATGSTIDVDLSAIIANMNPFAASDFGRVTYGTATVDGGDNLRGPPAVVSLTILSATTVRLFFASNIASIGQYQINLAWGSTITRDSC